MDRVGQWWYKGRYENEAKIVFVKQAERTSVVKWIRKKNKLNQNIIDEAMDEDLTDAYRMSKLKTSLMINRERAKTCGGVGCMLFLVMITVIAALAITLDQMNNWDARETTWRRKIVKCVNCTIITQTREELPMPFFTSLTGTFNQTE